LAEALKDRGWLYFLRQEWEKAEADLLCALEVVHADARGLQGAIYDAMANLYRKTGAHERAVSYAELALALREEDGDLLGVAKSHGNLGLLYRSNGEYAHAIAAYTEAMATYARIGNQELVAVALLNLGAASFLAGDLTEAVARYQASLAISQTLDLALLAIKAHYNLAEAYVAQEQRAAAREHWQLGLHLCRQHAFDDQEQDFAALGVTLGLAPPLAPAVDTTPAAPPDALDREEAAVLALAQREGKITAQRLIESLHVSRATATRRLAALVEKELLQMAGKGRGVHYRPASATPGAAPAAAAPSVTALSVEIERELQELLPALRAQFGVAELRVAQSPAPGVLRLAVRFVTPPNLAGFFALERYLGDVLQRAVDLVPEG
jgi:tetratricopeptide (TPR) repeat protein